MFFLASFFDWHYDGRQCLLLPAYRRHSSTLCRTILFHVWVESLRLASIYFEVADSTNWVVGPELALLCVSEFVNCVFLFAPSDLVVLIASFRCIVRYLGHALWVIWERVSAAISQTHCTRVLAYWCVVRQCLVHLSQVFKVVAFKSLASGHSMTVIIDQHLGYDFCCFRTHIWDQLGDSWSLLRYKIELHMACHSLKLLKQLSGWCA